MSDSPMWNRGNRSRSKSRTRYPCFATSAETVEPAGPPPMTATSIMGSGIPRVPVLGEEELVDQAVHLEEPLPVEPELVAAVFQVAAVLQRLQRRREPLLELDPELLPEVAGADVAELELQDELAD